MSRSSVQAVNPDELKTDTIKDQIQASDRSIKTKIGNNINSLIDLPFARQEAFIYP
jgi:hypothetical protein